MAVNDELGITHQGNGDNANLGAILDLLIEQLKPMLVAQFASYAARGIAYPDLSKAPKLNIVGSTLEAWSPGLQAFFPLGGQIVYQNKLATNAGLAAGAGGQIGVTFDGPAGTYIVLGTMGIANQTSTTQIGTGEVRFDSQSSGTLPFTMTDTRVENVSRAWWFTTSSSGSHTAQMVCTPTAFPATVYHDSAVLVFYTGTYA